MESIEEEATDAVTEETTPTGEAASGIAAAVMEDPRFSTLASAIESAGLTETLSTGGPYTIFAPTNEAFDAFPEGWSESLGTDSLASLLQYHVVAGQLTPGEIQSMAALTTVNGADIQVIVRDGQAVLNPESEHAALIVEAGIPAENGVIHAIDDVLMTSF